MKKVLLTLTILFTAVFAQAQRKADISVRMNSPVNGAKVRTGQNFTVNVTVINNGPDNILTSDTMLYYLGAGNVYFPQSQAFLPISTDMLPGDSLNFNVTQGLTGGNGAPMSLCSYVVVFNRAQPDSVYDVLLGGNNRSCNSVTYSGVGIGELTAGLNFPSKVYPNPATSQMFLEFNSASNETAVINIYDVEGKLVRTFNNYSEFEGTQLVEMSVDGMTKGIYFYSVSVGNTNTSGKFIVE